MMESFKMIKKFISIEKADEYVWVYNPDADYYKKMNEFFIMIEKLSGFKVKKGIQKFKNPFASGKSV